MQLELEIEITVTQCLGMENGKEVSHSGGRMQSFRFNLLKSSVETEDQIMM